MSAMPPSEEDDEDEEDEEEEDDAGFFFLPELVELEELEESEEPLLLSSLSRIGIAAIIIRDTVFLLTPVCWETSSSAAS